MSINVNGRNHNMNTHNMNMHNVVFSPVPLQEELRKQPLMIPPTDLQQLQCSFQEPQQQPAHHHHQQHQHQQQQQQQQYMTTTSHRNSRQGIMDELRIKIGCTVPSNSNRKRSANAITHSVASAPTSSVPRWWFGDDIRLHICSYCSDDPGIFFFVGFRLQECLVSTATLCNGTTSQNLDHNSIPLFLPSADRQR